MQLPKYYFLTSFQQSGWLYYGLVAAESIEYLKLPFVTVFLYFECLWHCDYARINMTIGHGHRGAILNSLPFSCICHFIFLCDRQQLIRS